jgi:RNA polymerase sigma factor (sigma-70 family)
MISELTITNEHRQLAAALKNHRIFQSWAYNDLLSYVWQYAPTDNVPFTKKVVIIKRRIIDEERATKKLRTKNAKTHCSNHFNMGDDIEKFYGSKLLTKDKNFDRIDFRLLVEDFKLLTSREKLILLLLYLEGMSQKEVSEVIGVSHSSISLTLKDLLPRLKSMICDR